MSETAVAGMVADTAISEVQRLSDDLESVEAARVALRADLEELQREFDLQAEEVSLQRKRIAELVAQLDEMKRQETRGVRIGGTRLSREEVVELRWAVTAAVERTQKAVKAIEKEDLEAALEPLELRLETLRDLHKLLNPGIDEAHSSEPQTRRRKASVEDVVAKAQDAVDRALSDPVDAADPVDVLVTLLNKRDLGAAFTPEIVGSWTEEERRHVRGWLDGITLWEQEDSASEYPLQAPFAVKRALYDAEATFDVLSLILEPERMPSRELIAGWSDEDRVAVAEYAGAVHVQASDNDDYPVPLMPQVLVDHAVGEGLFRVNHFSRSEAPDDVEAGDRAWFVAGPEETVDFFAHPWQAIDRARRLNSRAAEFAQPGLEPADLARMVAADYENEGQRRWEGILQIGMEHLDPYLLALRLALLPDERAQDTWGLAFNDEYSGEGLVALAARLMEPPAEVRLMDGGVVRTDVLPGSRALLVEVQPREGDAKKWTGNALVEPIRLALADLIPTDTLIDELGRGEEDAPANSISEEYENAFAHEDDFEDEDAGEVSPSIQNEEWELGEDSREQWESGEEQPEPGEYDGPALGEPDPRGGQQLVEEPAAPRYRVVGARKPVKIVDITTGQVVPGCDDLSKGEAVAKAAAWNRTPELAPAAIPAAETYIYPTELLARLSEEERKAVTGGEYYVEAMGDSIYHVRNGDHVRSVKSNAHEADVARDRFNAAREALLNGKQPEHEPALPAEHPAMGGLTADEALEAGYDGPMHPDAVPNLNLGVTLTAISTELSPLDQLLAHALYRNAGPDVWPSIQRRGVTDDGLSQIISEAFGTDERITLEGVGKARVRGGIHPQFAALVVGQEKAVTIMGQVLVQHVRSLLQIPQPQQAQEPQAEDPFSRFCDECFTTLNADGVCESCGWVKE
jgi:hypothetical protein